jgi:hypothetical protein
MKKLAYIVLLSVLLTPAFAQCPGYNSSYTPVLLFNGQPGTGVQYGSNQAGSYQVTGNKVDVSFCVGLANKGTSTGNLSISLPVAPSATLAQAGNGAVTFWGGTGLVGGALTANVNTGFGGGGAQALLYQLTSTGVGWVSASNLTNTSQFCGFVSYFK